MRTTFWANANLANVIRIDQELGKGWSVPTSMRGVLDDVGLIEGLLFVGVSGRTVEEVQRQLGFDPLAARAEWSLNRRDLDYYLDGPATTVAEAFRAFMAASLYLMEATRMLGVNIIYCEFSAPCRMVDLSEHMHHASWTCHQAEGEFVYDPNELDEFAINSMAGLLLER